MPIKFDCPECKKLLTVPDTAAGAKVRCPNCSTVSVAPANAGDGFGLPSQSGTPAPVPTPQAPAKPEFNPYASPSAGGFSPEDTPHVPGGINPTVVGFDEIFNHSLQVWQDNLGILIGTTAILLGISLAMNFVLSTIVGVVAENAGPDVAMLLNYAGSFVTGAVTTFITIGQVQIVLRILRGQPTSIGDLFGGGSRFLPVYGISLLAGIAISLGFMLCIVPGILLLLFFWPFYYLLVDEKAGAFESFEVGYSFAQINVGTTALIGLVSFGIYLLGVLACCVGVIAAMPLITTMWVTAYLMMSGQLATR